jgi:hypothetical protein
VRSKIVPSVSWLALAFDLGDDHYHWDAINCATVLEFLSTIEPTEGNCFCHDQSSPSPTRL